MKGGDCELQHHLLLKHGEAACLPSTKRLLAVELSKPVKIRADWIQNIYEVSPMGTIRLDKQSIQPEYQPSKTNWLEFECKCCLKRGRNQYLIRTCMLRHGTVFSFEGDANCPLCNKYLESKLELADHFRHWHTGQTCCLCLL